MSIVADEVTSEDADRRTMRLFMSRLDREMPGLTPAQRNAVKRIVRDVFLK